jgi:cytochrome c oxidase subunit 3
MTQQYDAGQLGMWVFLMTEIMFFGGMIIAYIIYRGAYPQSFAAGSHHLDITLGTVNTVVLIGSSLTMAMAVYAAQMGRRTTLVMYLLVTLGLGLIFLGIKAVE